MNNSLPGTGGKGVIFQIAGRGEFPIQDLANNLSYKYSAPGGRIENETPGARQNSLQKNGNKQLRHRPPWHYYIRAMSVFVLRTDGANDSVQCGAGSGW